MDLWTILERQDCLSYKTDKIRECLLIITTWTEMSFSSLFQIFLINLAELKN